MAQIEFDVFLELHQSQLELSSVPKHYWDTLYSKLQNVTFDAGKVFTLLQIEYEDERLAYDPPWELRVKAEDGIDASTSEHIYLIDHAWTFRIENARKQLKGIDSLRQRMAGIVGLDPDLEAEELAENIFEDIWKYCDCYWTQTSEIIEDRVAVWYMMDEVGSAIQHNESPNFRNVEDGEVITRNFVERPTDKDTRAALLLPWVYTSFSNVNFINEEPDPDYFLSGHIQESLPILSKLQALKMQKDKYKVFAEYALIQEYLTDKAFEIVSQEEEADILWYTRHFKDFERLCETPHKFINQFPFEYVLTVKDLLCITARRKANAGDSLKFASSPAWLPVTYNLKTELPQFVSYYQQRKENGLDNHWIIKPFNLARGLDTHITENLNYIVRLPITGPKIAQKYIDKPVLFDRSECGGKVKFDIRYVILLKNVKPLEVYVYKNFFLRFANQPFKMRDFDQYNQHFTVMNYVDDGKNLKHMTCEEFQTQWQQQYPNIPWGEVERSILQMFREVLQCAIMECPPCGISESPQSRALYAADLMLEWTSESEVQPKLLEINWTPDCERACQYYPDFFNYIFKLLFVDVSNSDVFYCL